MNHPVTARLARRHRWVTMVGLAGSVLGVAAGIVQVTVGAEIPRWSGAKSAPVALGLLTIGLSVLAGWGAVTQRGRRSTLRRSANAVAMVGPALLCLSTAGGLWYVPAVLLAVAGLLSIDSWRDTGRALADNWFRLLLSALGAFEMLMAAGASSLLLVVGVVTGLILLVAPWLRPTPPLVVIGLIAVGTVPFAVVAWTAVIPVLLVAVAGGVAIPVFRQRVPVSAPDDRPAGAVS